MMLFDAAWNRSCFLCCGWSRPRPSPKVQGLLKDPLEDSLCHVCTVISTWCETSTSSNHTRPPQLTHYIHQESESVCSIASHGCKRLLLHATRNNFCTNKQPTDQMKCVWTCLAQHHMCMCWCCCCCWQCMGWWHRSQAPMCNIC